MRPIKLTALALAMAAIASPTLAADQVIDLSSGQASFDSIGPILDGGDDLLTFTGLAPGQYEFVFSVSAQFITSFAGTVNSAPFATAVLGPITAGALFGVDNAPFSVLLTGTPNSSRAIYSGELTVTPVIPEPGTYALLAAGLGVVAAIARRRRQV